MLTSPQNQIVFLHLPSHGIQATAHEGLSVNILTHGERYVGGVTPAHVRGMERGFKWHRSIHPFHVGYAVGESALQADGFG